MPVDPAIAGRLREPGVIHGHLSMQGLAATDRSLRVLARRLLRRTAATTVRA